MLDFDEKNKYIAEMYVDRHLNEMINKLEEDGYFVYDEYETIYIHAGRFIPSILNNKLLLDEKDDDILLAVEEMIEGEGNCGIVIKQSIYDRNFVRQLLENFYKR